MDGFLTLRIAQAIYKKYFTVRRMVGRLDPGFVEMINDTMVCLTCAKWGHSLRVG